MYPMRSHLPERQRAAEDADPGVAPHHVLHQLLAAPQNQEGHRRVLQRQQLHRTRNMRSITASNPKPRTVKILNPRMRLPSLIPHAQHTSIPRKSFINPGILARLISTGAATQAPCTPYLQMLRVRGGMNGLILQYTVPAALVRGKWIILGENIIFTNGTVNYYTARRAAQKNSVPCPPPFAQRKGGTRNFKARTTLYFIAIKYHSRINSPVSTDTPQMYVPYDRQSMRSPDELDLFQLRESLTFFRNGKTLGPTG